MTSVEHCDQQLLPGLPDQITLYQITPRLSWRDFHILASASRSWWGAIASRQVYDARGFTKTTQTLVLFNSYTDNNCRGETNSVYSLRDRLCFEFPPLPKVARGVMWNCARQWVALDGRVYVLGGELACDQDKVYVLDVAGQQRQWKQCASMTQPRLLPECVVFNGKIYVFGSSNGATGPNCDSEVYGPKENTWSPIRQHGALVKGFYHVLPVGEEIFVHCGLAQHPASRKSLLVYHPIRDEWRLETKVFAHRPLVDVEFVAQGKLHSMCRSAVYVYDIENSSWVNLHCFSFCNVAPAHGAVVGILAVVALDDELLAAVNWFDAANLERAYYFFHSRGFRGHSKEIFWEVVYKCSSCPSDLKTIQV